MTNESKIHNLNVMMKGVKIMEDNTLEEMMEYATKCNGDYSPELLKGELMLKALNEIKDNIEMCEYLVESSGLDIENDIKKAELDPKEYSQLLRKDILKSKLESVLSRL